MSFLENDDTVIILSAFSQIKAYTFGSTSTHFLANPQGSVQSLCHESLQFV